MAEHWRTIDDVRADAAVCCRCDLCYSRTHVVFGEGPAPARLMIVGEGPGADEDEQARPFVGRAGKLLDTLLSDAGIRREDAWITNIVRCRPATKQAGALRNRAPRPDEIKACNVWMTQEFRFVSPQFVVCLGAVPAQVLISPGFRVGEGCGRWHEGRGGIPATATYHPAYVLRFVGEARRSVEERMLEDFRLVARDLAVRRAAAIRG
ncbi:MAG TPA: uracil-DNA glycosylase [Armatimonadota bacterium]|nr:uracil-DNA glycosylase [Armatimonadota bacterium]